MRLVFDDDVLALLAEIAAHHAHATALAEEVFRRRRDEGSDVAGWVDQIEKAHLSILGVFGHTRLVYIAADELGIRLEPEPEGDAPSRPLVRRGSAGRGTKAGRLNLELNIPIGRSIQWN